MAHEHSCDVPPHWSKLVLAALVLTAADHASAICFDQTRNVDLKLVSVAVAGPESNGTVHVTVNYWLGIHGASGSVPSIPIEITTSSGDPVATAATNAVDLTLGCSGQGWGQRDSCGECWIFDSIWGPRRGYCWCKSTPSGRYRRCECKDPNLIASTFNIAVAPSGTTLVIRIDPQNVLDEYDECNNTATITVP
jgi:hypothetical protein